MPTNHSSSFVRHFSDFALSPTITRVEEGETARTGEIKHVRAQLLLHTCHQRLIWAAYMDLAASDRWSRLSDQPYREAHVLE